MKYNGHSSGLEIPGIGTLHTGDEITVGDGLAKQLLSRRDFVEIKELYEHKPETEPKKEVSAPAESVPVIEIEDDEEPEREFEEEDIE